MRTSGCLHDLIGDLWLILHTNRTPRDISFWRERSVFCLRRLLGPDHYYTQLFENLGQRADKSSLLTAAGILAAAKEEVDKVTQNADCLVLPGATPPSA